MIGRLFTGQPDYVAWWLNFVFLLKLAYPYRGLITIHHWHLDVH